MLLACTTLLHTLAHASYNRLHITTSTIQHCSNNKTTWVFDMGNRAYNDVGFAMWIKTSLSGGVWSISQNRTSLHSVHYQTPYDYGFLFIMFLHCSFFYLQTTTNKISTKNCLSNARAFITYILAENVHNAVLLTLAKTERRENTKIVNLWRTEFVRI